MTRPQRAGDAPTPRVVELRFVVSDWLRRALLAVRGADRDLEAAELALAHGDAPRALRHARALARQVPDMPACRAIAADAAAMSGLFEEALAHADALAESVQPSARIELARGVYARATGRRDDGEASLRRAASLRDDRDASRTAALLLAESDLDAGAPARALQWLRGLDGAYAATLRASALLELGRSDEARAEAATLPLPPTDGRHALLFAALAAGSRDVAAHDVRRALFRAYVLDVPGAARALGRHVATHPESAAIVKPVVAEKGELDAPLFRAAFAAADGDADGARRALAAGARAGDLEAARALAQVAIAGLDLGLLGDAHAAMEAAGASPPDGERLWVLAAARLTAGDPRAALGALGDAGDGRVAAHLRDVAAACLAPDDGPIALAAVVAELRDAARALGEDEVLLATEALSRAAERPPRMAVLGEFNAGKSTLVNALLGAEVAPMSVLPMTAVLHHVRYAAEPYARLSLGDGGERVVEPRALAAALAESSAAGGRASRVTIGLPFEPLRRVELIDTPGFNAPEVEHAREAERALDEVDVALWLFDATQLGKASEVSRLRAVVDAGVPFLCVANKRDRLAPGDVCVVEHALVDVLAGVGAAPLAPPVLVSARQALAERLGRADAAPGGARELDETFERGVLQRARTLHERSLRRRAAGLAATLLGAASASAARERDALDAAERQQRAVVAMARRLDDAVTAQKAVAESVAAARAALSKDLCAVGQASDDDARAYVEDRTVAHLGRPIAAGLTGSSSPSAAVVSAVEAALRGLVAGLARPSAAAELPATTLTQATIGAARAALHAAAAAPRAELRAWQLSLRVAALHRALSRQTAGTSPGVLLSPAAT